MAEIGLKGLKFRKSRRFGPSRSKVAAFWCTRGPFFKLKTTSFWIS